MAMRRGPPAAPADGRSSCTSTIRHAGAQIAAGGTRRPAAGSAAASASQVEALLRRLEELEARVAESSASEADLKAVNVALMERLAAFKHANEENVEIAERELGTLHKSLQEARAARGEAEAAAEEAWTQLIELKKHSLGVAVSAQGAEEEAERERGRADEYKAELERGVLAGRRSARCEALARRALLRKCVKLSRKLRERARNSK